MLEIIQRYKGIIEEIPLNKKIKILDVGGGAESIAPFISQKIDITSCDISFRGKKLVKTVKCSAEKLPFKNKSFDYVISIDALEHIPKSKRKKSIEEMMRVSREKVIIACPCGKQSQKYEEKLIKFASLFGKTLSWLEEHKKEGLPNMPEIISVIKNNRYKIKRNMNLNLWFLLHFIDFLTRPIQNMIGPRKMMVFYGPLTKLFNFGRCYRLIFVVDSRK